jgi:hypothetical protein
MTGVTRKKTGELTCMDDVQLYRVHVNVEKFSIGTNGEVVNKMFFSDFKSATIFTCNSYIIATHVANVTNFAPNFVDFVGENDCQTSVFLALFQ